MPYCLLSFGSNLGDRFARIRRAAAAIADHDQVRNFVASRLYETPPIGGPEGQEPFLNGVARIETSLGADDVLRLLQHIEQDLGRERAVRWDARAIDLDVVLYGDLQGENRRLAVPHPRYMARRFVLIPAAEIAAAWRDPRIGWTIAQLAQHLEQAPPSLALTGGTQEMRESLCHALHERFGVTVFTESTPGVPPDASVPWVASFLPAIPFPTCSSPAAADQTMGLSRMRNSPRLIAHLQWTTPESRWPATHQIWHSDLSWPQYRLEIDSPQWAAAELASALLSMNCPLAPVTDDGLWYLDGKVD